LREIDLVHVWRRIGGFLRGNPDLGRRDDEHRAQHQE
jgi:hypothetical protein